MSEFHDDFPNYELMAQHSEEEGAPKRKALWRVFWIMLVITLVELAIGFKAESLGLLSETRNSGFLLKFIFITLTIVKAYYIVYSFMHLGHEVRPLKWIIIAPFSVFVVYLILMASIGEGAYSKDNRAEMSALVVKQAQERQKGGGHHEGGGNHEEHKTEESHENNH